MSRDENTTRDVQAIANLMNPGMCPATLTTESIQLLVDRLIESSGSGWDALDDVLDEIVRSAYNRGILVALDALENLPRTDMGPVVSDNVRALKEGILAAMVKG